MPTEPNAIILPAAGLVNSTEAQFFPGLPGRFVPGEPVLLRTVDLTVEEAKSLIEDLGVPLELVDHGKRAEAEPVPDENPPRGKGDAPAETPDLTPMPPLVVEAPTEKGAPDPGRSVSAALAAGADDDGGSK